MPRLIPIIVAITLFCIVMATIDIRYTLIGLMLLFLIIPFIVFHIYFSKLLTDKSVKALALKCVEIRPDASVAVTYLRQFDEDTEPTTTGTEIIQSAQIKTIRSYGDYITITSHNADNYPLIIPKSALSAQEIGTIISLNPVGYMDKNN